MLTASFKTAALAIAAGGMVLSVPASAAPSAHASAWAESSPVYGDMTYEHGREYREERHERRHHYKRHRYDRYSDRRAPVRHRNYYRDYPRSYGEPAYRSTRVWRGDNGRYYCRKSDGTTGLLVGAGVGALLGREVAGRGGDRTLGAILGAVGGGLLGKSLDKGTRCE